MAKLTNDSNNQTYIYHQLTIHNSHDSEDDFRSGCRNVSLVNNNSSFQNYTNPDDHTQQTRSIIFANFTPVWRETTILPICINSYSFLSS